MVAKDHLGASLEDICISSNQNKIGLRVKIAHKSQQTLNIICDPNFLCKKMFSYKYISFSKGNMITLYT